MRGRAEKSVASAVGRIETRNVLVEGLCCGCQEVRVCGAKGICFTTVLRSSFTVMVFPSKCTRTQMYKWCVLAPCLGGEIWSSLIGRCVILKCGAKCICLRCLHFSFFILNITVSRACLPVVPIVTMVEMSNRRFIAVDKVLTLLLAPCRNYVRNPCSRG